MNWIREHTRITIILAILLALIILSVASFIHSGNSSFLGQQIQRVTTFIQEPVSDGTSGLSRAIKGIFQFKSVLEENDRLREEVKALEEELIENRLTMAELEELRELALGLNYDFLDERYTTVTADAISMDGSNWFNIFTINAGSEAGISVDNIVTNGDGLVGRILEVGEGYSKVISVIDQNNKVSFRVLRDLELLGVLYGDGEGGLQGYMIDGDASINEGDTLITSGMQLYPAGIKIGKISEIQEEDSLLKYITIEPEVYFKNISKVTVIVPVR